MPLLPVAHPCAQRLAASQEKSLSLGVHAGDSPISAQRLAASQEKSLGVLREFAVVVIVLNASRHHRKNRAFLPNISSPPRLVLNASRHHRKNRSTSRRSPDPATRVLNASRHHRKNRPSVRILLFLICWCSTPRGITGKIAVTSDRRLYNLNRAQRLAASQEKSLCLSCSSVISKLVLNASRHHRKNRTTGTRGQPS